MPNSVFVRRKDLLFVQPLQNYLQHQEQDAFCTRSDPLVTEIIAEVQNPVVTEIRKRGRPKGSRKNYV